MKNIIKIVLGLILLLPVTASAYTGGWSYTSTSSPAFYPNPVFGKFANVLAPYFTATSTTATSTFNGAVSFPSGIWNTLGNVGIGTTGPGAKLAVNGNVYLNQVLDNGYNANIEATGDMTFFGNTAGTEILLDYANSGVNYIDATNFTAFRNTAGTVESMRITNNGNVGIGTTVPGYKLDVAGNINISAGSTYAYNGTPWSFGSTTLSNWYINGAGNFYTQSTQTGNANNGAGAAALSSVTSGYVNNAMGAYALLNNTTGYSNTAVGGQSLENVTTGYQNVGIGRLSGGTLLSGSSNTFLGNQADVSAAASTTLSNSTAIGNGAIVTQSNEMVLGNTSVSQTLLNGNVGIGTTNPGAKLEIYHDSANGVLYQDLLINGGTQNGAVSGSGHIIGFVSAGAVYSGAVGGYGNGSTAGLGLWGGTNSGSPQVYVQSGGNVGIGTTTPGTALSVIGTTTTQGLNISNLSNTVLAVDGSGNVIATTTSSGGGGSGNSAWTIGNRFIYNATTTDAVSIGTTSSSTSLLIQAKTGINPFSIKSTNGSSTVTISSQGALCVGTLSSNCTAPQIIISNIPAPSTVVGPSSLTNGNAMNNVRATGTGNAYFSFTTDGVADRNAMGYNGSSGQFEISTGGIIGTTVQAVLNDTTLQWGFGSSTPSAKVSIEGSGKYDEFSVASSTGVVSLNVNVNGNVGISTSSPQVPLSVVGNIATASSTAPTTDYANDLVCYVDVGSAINVLGHMLDPGGVPTGTCIAN